MMKNSKKWWIGSMLICLLGAQIGAYGQFSYTTQIGQLSTSGDTLVFNIPVPTSARAVTGNVQVDLYVEGDLDLASEYYDLITENGYNYGSTNSFSQCAGSFGLTSYSIPVDSIRAWASDGVVTFIADASSAVGVFCTYDGGYMQVSWDAAYGVNNAALTSVDSPSVFCAGTEDIWVTVSNAGTNQITSLKIDWELGGTAQTGVTLNQTLDTTGGTNPISRMVKLGTKNITSPTTLKVWTSKPSGNTDTVPDNDTLEVVLSPSLQGTFTIGGSGADYAKIGDAVAHMNTAGICGPVTFRLNAQTFNEQVVIGAIPGASATNTIRFVGQGADNTAISYSGSSTADWTTVLLDGADFVTMDSMSIIAASTSSYGATVWFTNDADSNRITNCELLADPNNSGTTARLNVVFSASSSSYSSYGNSGQGNLIEGCLIRGGYFNVSQYGSGSTSASTYVNGNSFINNELYRSYYYGFYFLYTGQKTIQGNIVDSVNNSSGYGMRNYYCARDHIIGNVFNGGSYGMYQYYANYSGYTSADTSYIFNNMFSATGTAGLYTYGNYQTLFYNNSVYSSGTYGAYFGIPYNGSESRNNSFHCDGTYAAYLNTTSTSVSSTFFDYNNYYAPNGSVAYHGGARSTLATWQSAYSSHNTNSISVNPEYTSTIDLHTLSVDLNNKGIALSHITTDIDGETRPFSPDLIPDIGADEYYLAPFDLDVVSITPSVVASSTATDVTATFRNTGINPIVNDTAYVSWRMNSGSWMADTIIIDSLALGADTVFTFTKQLTVSGSSGFTLCASIDGGITGDPDNSDEYCGNGCVGISGTFTIDGSGNGDFQTFGAAISSLSGCGIAGPVVFNVKAGTFNEQITIGEINGASATNTISFVGAGKSSTTLTNSSTSSTDRYTVLLDGADYVVFQDMTIESGGVSYASTVWFTGGANFNRIENCNLMSNTNSTSSNYLNVVFSASSTSYSSYGTSGEFNTIEDCLIRGGYFNVSQYGSGSTAVGSYQNGNRFINNELYQAYYYGFYFLYTGQKWIEGNTVDSLRTTSGYAMRNYYCARDRIIGNQFHGNAYGLYQYYANYSGYTADDTTYIFNNMFTSTGTSPLYTYGNYQTLFYHNSIYGGSSYGAYFGIPYYGSEARNNSFYSTGSYAVYLNTTSSLVSSTFFDYNNYYAPSGSVAYHGGSRSTLAIWQTAYSSHNQNSISVDPDYTSTSDLHSRSLSLNNVGVALAQVTTDIDGEMRPLAPDVVPDIGADEYYLPPFDLDAIAINQPAVANIGNNTVQATFTNNGIDTIKNDTAILAFSVDGSTTLTDTLFISSLSPGGTVNKTFSGNWNISSNARYEICVDITDGVRGDPDTLEAYCIDKCPAASGTYSIDPQGNGDFQSFAEALDFLYNCAGAVGGPLTFNVGSGTYNEKVVLTALSGMSATNTVTFKGVNRWLSTLTYQGSSGDMPTVLLDGASYFRFENLTIENTASNTYSTGIMLYNGASSNQIVNCNVVNASTTTSVAACIAFTASTTSNTSSGSASAGDYNSIEGCRIIGGGYYGIRMNGRSSSNRIKGTRIVGNTFRDQYYYPFYELYGDSTLIDGNDIDSATYSSSYGIYTSSCSRHTISNNRVVANRYGLYQVTENSSTSDSSWTYNNMISTVNNSSDRGVYWSSVDRVIFLHNSVVNSGTSTSTSYATFYFSGSDYNVVKNNTFSSMSNGYVIYHSSGTIDAGDWDYNNYYDQGSATSKYRLSGSTYATAAAMISGQTSYNQNSIVGDPNHGSLYDLHVTGGHLNNKGDNSTSVAFDIDGNTRPYSPNLIVDIGADEYLHSDYDADVDAITSPLVLKLGSSNTVTASIQNNGDSAFVNDTIYVQYAVNGGTPTVDTVFVTALNPGNSQSFTFNSGFTPVTDQNYEVCVSISPKFKTDLDTADVVCRTYCPGSSDTVVVDPTGNGDFTTINAAVNSLNCGGVAGPTVIWLKEGVYSESVTLTPKLGMDATNTVTIVGENRDKVVWNPATSGSFYTVLFDGADYFRLSNLTVRNMNTNTQNGCAVLLMNDANYNTLTNCNLMASVTTSNSGTAVLATSSSSTSIFGYSQNADYLTIDNCTIQGGYYGLRLNGSSSVTLDEGNVVSNNLFERQYYYPIFSYYQGDIEVSGNEINPTNYQYGTCVYTYYNQRSRMFSNTIRGTAYGIYNLYNNLNSTSDTSWFYNNSISLVNNDANAYPGIYSVSTYGHRYWHNTIVTTTTSSSTFGAPLYLSSTTNNDIRNNVLAAMNGGQIIYSTGSSLVGNGALDNNDYYSSSSSRIYWNGTYTDLSTWQSALSTENLSSVDVDPYLTSETNHHAGAIELIGSGANLGVAMDFEGDMRDATKPDIGADEIMKDIAMASVTAPGTECRTPSASNQVSVVIENTGVSRLAPGDSLFVSFMQGTQLSSDTLVLTTNTFDPGQTASYTFTGNLNTGTPGANSVSVYSSLAVGDVNANNDTFVHPYFTNPVPVPAFSGSDACLNDSSSFSNTSSITLGSIADYKWYFGDGDSSMMMTPKHLYGSYDTFTVWLMATSDSGCMSTASMDVVVNPNPSANFTTSNVCHHEQASFTNGTTIPHGMLTHAWDFGDNTNTSASESPTLTYSNDGSYTVELTATSDEGCTDVATKGITIFPTPDPAFTPSEECESDATSFTDQTTISSGTYSNSWSFGDGNTSTQTSPTNTYASAGSYTAKLVSSTSNGCKDSVTGSVLVNPLPTSSFQVVSMCFGDTLGPVNNSSGNIASYQWYFGDGNTSSSASPENRYTNSGTYDVSLVVTTNKGCRDSSSAQVSVATQPQSAFTATSECVHDEIQFANQTSVACGAVSSYLWIYGDGKTETFTTSTDPSHKYTQAGTYTAQLIISLGNGIKDTSSRTITVLEAPTAAFTNNATCEGKVVQFTSTSSNGSGNLNGYSWTFGDGGSSTLRNPTNTYSSSGNYTVTLIARDDNGCSDTATAMAAVSPNPSASFTASNDCEGDSIAFTNTSTIGSGSLTYMWNFGDNTTGTTTSPVKAYGSASYYQVKLVATSNAGCKDSTTKTLQVYANPSASFSASAVCDGDAMSFSNQSNGASSYSWDFGDNAGTSNSSGPTYTYGTAGSYDVTLTTTSSQGCLGMVTKSVTVNSLPTPSFSASDVCLGEQVSFTNSSSGASSYSWAYGDGSGSNLNAPKHTYSASGRYNVELEATSSAGCKASTNDTVEIYALPKASFSASDVCDGKAMSFTNNSTGASGYAWDFGDNSGTSSSTAPSYTYSTSGTYTVVLTASTTQGCEDVATADRTVNPNPSVSFSANSVCDGNAVNFSNSSSISSGTMSHSWDFGDNSGTSNNTSPTYTYSGANTYSAKLTSTSDKGCTGSANNNVTIYANPTANFSSSNVCLNDAMSFSNSSSGATSYEWDFGDGSSTVSNTSPSYTYSNQGTYTVSLTAKSSNGCEDIVTKKVTVYGNPSVSFTANNVCDGVAMTTTNSTSGASTYAWDFGDGTSSSQSTPTHTYASANSYTVKLVGTSGNGCKDSNTTSITVYALPSVGFSATTECQGETTSFTNSTMGATSYTWSFGDGTIGNGTNSTHLYAKAGTYSVQLMATSSNNCSASATNSVSVNPTPVAAFTSSDVCAEDSMRFSNGSTGAAAYTWYFGDGDSSSMMAPAHYYGTEGNYSVRLVATSAAGCLDETSTTMRVNDKPDASFAYVYQNTAELDCEDEVYVFAVDSIQSNVITYEWNFSDGKGAQYGRTVNQAWTTAGDYGASLMLTTVSGCTDQVTTNVTIHPNPMAMFESNDTCLNQEIQFVNQSSSVDQVSYNWNFGDGTISGAANPAHTYTTTSGNYAVELTATTVEGCFSRYSRSVVIHPVPSADFAVADVCEGSVSQFNNTSSISSGTMSFDWNLGNGDNTEDQSPELIYSVYGAYDVALQVTSDYGCTANFGLTHNVFEQPNAQLLTPSTLCEGTAIEVPDSFRSAIRSTWTVKYDDGNGSVYDSIPSLSYSAEGIYTPYWTIETENGCYDSASATIEVLPLPTATWTYRRGENGEITFTPDTLDGASYSWDFGDGNSSTDSVASNSFTTAGVTTVVLTVTGANGCPETHSRDVEIFPTGVEKVGQGHTLAAYPNPFASQTQVVCHLEHQAYVRMEVYDMNGKLLAVLADGNRAEGRHTLELTQGAIGNTTGNLMLRVIIDNDVHNLQMVRLR